jgi:hypothetical protein
MNFNLNVKLGAKSQKHSSKKSPREFINPIRDWTIGLFTATVLFLTGVVFIALDFYLQFIAEPQAFVAEDQLVVYPEKEVRHYAELYRKKEENFNALHSIIPFPVVDAVVETQATTTPEVIEPVPEAPLAE